jgi:hypothetical protein
MAEAGHPDTFHIPFPRIWDSLEGPFTIPVAALNTRACLQFCDTQIRRQILFAHYIQRIPSVDRSMDHKPVMSSSVHIRNYRGDGQ